MARRVCIISEDLAGPPDEGIRKFAFSLVSSLSSEYQVLGLSIGGIQAGPGLTALKTNRLFVSPGLARRLRQFRPDVICYVPSPSATLFSFVRSRIVKSYWPRARAIMVTLQPRSHSRIARFLIRYLCPDEVLTQEEAHARYLGQLGCHVRVIPSGVDLERFAPVPKYLKTALRTKYGLDRDAFTVLHVGHIRKGRNVELLAELKKAQDCQVVLVGGASNGQDPGLAHWLRSNGILLFESFLPHIEEVYQLSDCYLFPVFSRQASIQVPLSVLEAMACDLPVVSVPYGGLPRLFEEGDGLFFANSHQQLLECIASAKQTNGCHNREKVWSYSWQNIARQIVDGD